MKKKIVSSIITLFLINSFVACRSDSSIAQSSNFEDALSSEYTSSSNLLIVSNDLDDDSLPTENSTEIDNLPKEYYHTTRSESALASSVGFEVSKPTTFSLDLYTESGDMSIKVTDDKNNVLFGPINSTSGNYETTFSLDTPSSYRIHFKPKQHVGYIKISGENL